MLVSEDGEAVEKARFWATQSRDPARHYQHSEIGYNYRMSNIVAGIGRGTITEGSMELKEVRPLDGVSDEAVEEALSHLCAVMEDDTPTFCSIASRYGGKPSKKAERILPFSSEKKWSGAYFGEKGSYVLGAPRCSRITSF